MAAFILIAGSGLIVNLLKPKALVVSKPWSHHLSNPETEAYMVSKTTTNLVSSRFTPVLIYRITTNGLFVTGSGVHVNGKNNGSQVFTAEHLFSADSMPGPVGIRFTRPMEDYVSMFGDQVIFSNANFRGMDIASMSLTTDHTNDIPNFCQMPERSKTMVGALTFFTKASGKKISRLRSVATGEWHDVIATCSRTSDTNELPSIGINGFFIEGESGSGWIDEDESLYIMSQVEDEELPTWDGVVQSIRTRYHGKIEGLGFVYGPMDFPK